MLPFIAPKHSGAINSNKQEWMAWNRAIAASQSTVKIIPFHAGFIKSIAGINHGLARRLIQQTANWFNWNTGIGMITFKLFTSGLAIA